MANVSTVANIFAPCTNHQSNNIYINCLYAAVERMEVSFTFQIYFDESSPS